MMLLVAIKWMTKIRESPWWYWPVLVAYLAVLGVASVSLHFSQTTDWRQHLGFSHFATALTGVAIFVGLPLLSLALRRHRAVAVRQTSAADPAEEADGDLPGEQA
jgi:hypothetical protein